MPAIALHAALAAALLLTQAPLAARHSAARDDSLRARIERRVAEVPGAVVGVAYRDLAPGRDSLDVAADTTFHAASTMKVPVMIELVRQAESGSAALDQAVLLVNQFGSIVDGSPYALDPADDSDSSMYARVGQRIPVRELMEHMITRSSNLATNAVIALVGAARANETAHALGASRMRVLRGVEDQKAYDAGLNNTTTARDLAALMAAIAEDRAASPAGCALMREVLGRQEFNGEIPAGLPPGTRVAHKTGQITGVLHDAAIVYPAGRPPYVLVVLTRGIPDEKVARSLIADVSRAVYEHAARGAPTADGHAGR
ncbi:MAG: serine hydrolase [Gemmatimonadaceae bacterium]